MVEKYEIVVLILGLVALVVGFINREKLSYLPYKEIFAGAFLLFLTSWLFTNLETFLWGYILNLLEHLSQVLGGLLVATWCWKVFVKGENQ